MCSHLPEAIKEKNNSRKSRINLLCNTNSLLSFSSSFSLFSLTLPSLPFLLSHSSIFLLTRHFHTFVLIFFGFPFLSSLPSHTLLPFLYLPPFLPLVLLTLPPSIPTSLSCLPASKLSLSVLGWPSQLRPFRSQARRVEQRPGTCTLYSLLHSSSPPTVVQASNSTEKTRRSSVR